MTNYEFEAFNELERRVFALEQRLAILEAEREKRIMNEIERQRQLWEDIKNVRKETN